MFFTERNPSAARMGCREQRIPPLDPNDQDLQHSCPDCWDALTTDPRLTHGHEGPCSCCHQLHCSSCSSCAAFPTSVHDTNSEGCLLLRRRCRSGGGGGGTSCQSCQSSAVSSSNPLTSDQQGSWSRDSCHVTRRRHRPVSGCRRTMPTSSSLLFFACGLM